LLLLVLVGIIDSAALRQIPGYEKILETARQRNPSRRLTLPEGVARTIAALCHPATYWLTGSVLQVDGGENIVDDRTMEDEGLDCLDLLEETPGTLRGLVRELSHEDAAWKPAPDRFSVAEMLTHLSHREGHCYRMRVDRFLNEEMPGFEPDDAQMYLDLYREADAENSFDHFEEQRDTNMEFLRTLPRAAGERHAQGGGRNHAAANAPRVGHARPRTHPADRGIGARPHALAAGGQVRRKL
jgi:Enoyl-(Acyl carrier protein) reductase/DinB superfamily